MKIVENFDQIVVELSELYPEQSESFILSLAAVIQRNETEEQRNSLIAEAFVLGTGSPSALEAIVMALRDKSN